MSKAVIGNKCNIGQNVFIGDEVVIGNNVKIQNNVSIYTGVIIEDDVFLGPSCVLTNVINPRSAVVRKSEYKSTIIKKGATIGANATIVCGVTLSEYCFIGAGAVVTKDVPAFALVLGTPAKVVGYMSENGHKLVFDNDIAICPETATRYQKDYLGVRKIETL
jgi:UDP-2-acetamido-3-amino-2,3-dideoxy-glucuronate N-acetyltransferase